MLKRYLPKENFDHLVPEVHRCQIVFFCFPKLLKKSLLQSDLLLRRL